MNNLGEFAVNKYTNCRGTIQYGEDKDVKCDNNRYKNEPLNH